MLLASSLINSTLSIGDFCDRCLQKNWLSSDAETQLLRVTCFVADLPVWKTVPTKSPSSKKITRGHAIFMDFLGSVMIITVMDKAKDCIE